MNSYLDCDNVRIAIKRAKKSLVDYAEKNGLHENFGQSYVRNITDKFDNPVDYSQSMNIVRMQVLNFDNWCMTYTVKK